MAFGVTTRRIVFDQLSPISMAVVSQEAFIFSSEFFIIRYGVEKKCTTLHKTRIANVLCSPVPEKQNKKASPSTIPGIVFVTSAIPSIIRFHTAPRELLAVISDFHMRPVFRKQLSKVPHTASFCILPPNLHPEIQPGNAPWKIQSDTASPAQTTQ